MNYKHLTFGVFVLTSVLVPMIQGQQNGASAPLKKPFTSTHSSQQEEEGDRIFQQHCSRCHSAPDGFSPRISGTVVRHMRVRASLTQHEEVELLRFLNP